MLPTKKSPPRQDHADLTVLVYGPSKIVLGMVNLILFCDLEVTNDESGKPVYRRVMRTKPSPHYEAGDRTGRLPETIDLNFQAFIEAFNRPAAAPWASAPRSVLAPGDGQDKKPAPAGK